MPLSRPVASSLVEAYEPMSGYDEAFAEPGVPRELYADVLAAAEDADLEALAREVADDLDRRGVRFSGVSGDAPFVVDVVPRILARDEWGTLAAGLQQRARALNAYTTDVYGDQRIVSSGHVPERVVDEAEFLEPAMVGVDVAHGTYAGAAGLDVVRGVDGEFLVLEDNLRTPSGYTYAAAARQVIDQRAPFSPPPERAAFDETFALLGDALRALAPPGGDGEPLIVLLSDGPVNSAWYEHANLARRLGIPLVTLADLEPRAGRVFARIDGRLRPVDVVYRRTDDPRAFDERGEPTPIGAALYEACRSGTLGMFNAFGAGVADDKLAHAYVEEMVRFYLDEEPLVRSVPTYDLADEACRAEVLERLEELVVKPRSGQGGVGVVICAHARSEDVETARRAIRKNPERFIAQETVTLSTHPTLIDGALHPRHVDLRPFVLTVAGEAHVAPGGLTRVAFAEGALVVNSSQHGGGKDTWALH